MAVINEFNYAFENIKPIGICYRDPSNYSEEPKVVNNITKGIKLSELIKELTEVLEDRGDGYITGTTAECVNGTNFISGIVGVRASIDKGVGTKNRLSDMDDSIEYIFVTSTILD